MIALVALGSIGAWAVLGDSIDASVRCAAQAIVGARSGDCAGSTSAGALGARARDRAEGAGGGARAPRGAAAGSQTAALTAGNGSPRTVVGGNPDKCEPGTGPYACAIAPRSRYNRDVPFLSETASALQQTTVCPARGRPRGSRCNPLLYPVRRRDARAGRIAMVDGRGHSIGVLGDVVGVELNNGIRKHIDGKWYVYAFSTALASGQRASGWIPLRSLTAGARRHLRSVPRRVTPSPHRVRVRSRFRITGGDPAAFMHGEHGEKAMRVAPNFTQGRRAVDYLARSYGESGPLVHVNWGPPGRTAFAFDTFRVGVTFYRVAGVRAVRTPLYLEGSSTRAGKSLTFVYGYVMAEGVRRFGWVAMEAMRAVP